MRKSMKSRKSLLGLGLNSLSKAIPIGIIFMMTCHLSHIQFRNFNLGVKDTHQTGDSPFKKKGADIGPPYTHRIPRILHHIWFKNVTNKVINYAEPVEILSTCFLANCVDFPGGWIHKHWDEDTIKELKAWPLIQRFWTKHGVYGDPHKMSDIVRLAVLSEYGGAYMDSDVGCFKPFDTLLESPSLAGATLVGAQEVNRYFANGIVFATSKHPFIEWMLRALEPLDLLGGAWLVTGPLVWGQEFEKFSITHPDLALEVKILPPSVFCPLPVYGTFRDDFDIGPVWTINFYPFTNPEIFMKNFQEAKTRGGVYPHCQALQAEGPVAEILTDAERHFITSQQPKEEIFVSMEELRKSV